MKARNLFSYAMVALRTVRYQSVISANRVVRKTACAISAGEIRFASLSRLFGCAAIDVPPVRVCDLVARSLTWVDDSKIWFVAANGVAPTANRQFALRCCRRNCYSTRCIDHALR